MPNVEPIPKGRPSVSSYPTPNLADRIYKVRKDTRVEEFREPPAQGTPFEGPEKDRLEGFVFATAVPVTGDPAYYGYTDWYYLSERANQDAYNFTIDYPFPGCPRITRTYVYLRSQVPEPSPSDVDPIFEELQLVDQKVTRLDDPVLDSLFVGVTKVFQCSPVPLIRTADRADSVLPFNMRVAVPAVGETNEVEGEIADPSLAQDDWSKKEEQTGFNRKRVDAVVRALPDEGVTLDMGRQFRDGQEAHITQTWKAGQQELEPDEFLLEGTVDDVGNGTTVMERKTIESIFPHGRYSKEIPDIIPPEFRVAVPVVESEVSSLGTVDTDPDLETGDIRVQEEQITPFIKRVLRATRAAITLPVSLTNILTNRFKQIVSQVRTLQDSGTSTAVPSALRDVKVTQLGNDTELEEIEEVDEVFRGLVKEVGTEQVIPLRFRGANGQSTTSERVAGTVDESLTLGAGEVLRREEQEDDFTKKTTVTGIDFDTTPTLLGQDYDPTEDVIIPYEERLEASGTSLGDPKTEVTPLSSGLDVAKTINVDLATDVLDAYSLVFPGTADIQFPSVLTAVNTYCEVQSAEGDEHDNAGSAFWVGHGSWSLSPRSSANARVTALPDATPVISGPWTKNIPVTNYIFLLPYPVTSAQILTKLSTLSGVSISAWPKFFPREETIYCVGGTAAVQAKASAFAHDGGSSDSSEGAVSSGNGQSIDLDIQIKTIRIPETIHPDILFDGFLSDIFSASVSVTADAYLISDFKDATAEISAYVSTTLSATSSLVFGIEATAGAVTIPTTGHFLLNIDSSPYKYGYARFRCPVLNAADL